MSGHPVFDAAEHAVLHPVRTAEGWFGRDHRTSAAQPAAAVTINTRTPGGPVPNFFTDIKARAHTVIEDLEHLDENAIGAVEAIKANPDGVGIVNEIAAVAHLGDPQGLLTGLLAAAKAVRAALEAAAAATAATQAAGAGPQVAGQA